VKIVVKAQPKAPSPPPAASPTPGKPKRERPPKGPTKAELLALEGRKYVNFVWPLGLMEEVAKLAAGRGQKPNDYVLGLLLKHLKENGALS